MNIQEALNVFGLTGEVNQAELKKRLNASLLSIIQIKTQSAQR